MSNNSTHSSKEFDVVGIGNAIVDVLVKVEDSFLEMNSLVKGSMTLINENDAERLYQSIGSTTETSGGSAANTLAALSQLGSKSGFIGRVKDDKLGEIFMKDIRSAGAYFETQPITTGPSTARCIVFITPDAQRTMCTYLGASVLIAPESIDLSIASKTKVLYLEGYLWDDIEAKNTFIAAAKLCKDSGGEVALSLSDSFCVNRHRESFKDLVEHHIDILFANESELLSLYESEKINIALEKVSNSCKIIALTMGENGSIIKSGEEAWTINPYTFGSIIDTTGAGDLYAGGFLYGYTNNRALKECGEIGSICAGQIVTRIGSRSEGSLKSVINRHII